MASDWKSQCFGDPGVLEPNPDVGGIGVLIGFVGTAWFSVLLVVLHFYFIFDPTKNPFKDAKNAKDARSPNLRDRNPNHVDVLALRVLKTASFRPPSENEGIMSIILRQALLNLCDAQLLTGLGILLSGFVNLGHNSLSAYHWELVVYFAWFSNITHVSCLTVLRRQFHLEQSHRRWRLSLMAVLWLGLLVAMVPTFYFNWATGEETASRPASNARCFYDIKVARQAFYGRGCANMRDQYRAGVRVKGLEPGPDPPCPGLRVNQTQAFGSAILSFLIAAFSFPSRAVKLVEAWSSRAKSLFRDKCSAWTRALICSSLNKGRIFRTFLIIQLYMVAKVYADLLSSELSDVYWIIVSAMWGTIRLQKLRQTQETSALESEMEWQFGQILPVFLLLASVLTATAVPMLVGNGKQKASTTPCSTIDTVAGTPSEAGHRPLLFRRTHPEDEDFHNEGLEMGTVSRPSVDGEHPTVAGRGPVESQSPADEGVDSATLRSQHNSSSSRPGAPSQTTNSRHIFTYKLIEFESYLCELLDLTQLRPQPTTPDSNDLDPQRIRDRLNTYYRHSRPAAAAVFNACFQVLPVTVFFFLHISGTLGRNDTDAVEALRLYALNILATQPLVSLVGTLVWITGPAGRSGSGSRWMRGVRYFIVFYIVAMQPVNILLVSVGSGRRFGVYIWFSFVSAVVLLVLALVVPASSARKTVAPEGTGTGV